MTENIDSIQQIEISPLKMKAPSNCTTCKQHVSLHMFLLTIKDNDLRNYFYIICIIANVFI